MNNKYSVYVLNTRLILGFPCNSALLFVRITFLSDVVNRAVNII